MRYKRLLNRRFCALKYNIALQGFIFRFNGFFYCYSITILYMYKALLYVRLKPFMVMLSCRVVVCKDNNKVIDAGTTELLTGLLIGLLIILLVWMVLEIRCGEVESEKTLAWALPRPKRWFCDDILTDLHTLTIQETVYLILVF